MQVLAHHRLVRQLSRRRLTPEALIPVAHDIQQGKTDSLGKRLYKTRMRKPGHGKRGGYRTIAYYRAAQRLVFLYMYDKAEKTDLTNEEREALGLLAGQFDRNSEADWAALVGRGYYVQVPTRT